MTDPHRTTPPAAVTVATVVVWVAGVLSLLLALLVTVRVELREAEFGTRGVGWWLVVGVAGQLVLALAGVVVLRVRRSRWVVLGAAVVGLGGAVVVWTEVRSPALAAVLAVGSSVAGGCALRASARDWVARSV